MLYYETVFCRDIISTVSTFLDLDLEWTVSKKYLSHITQRSKQLSHMGFFLISCISCLCNSHRLIAVDWLTRFFFSGTVIGRKINHSVARRVFSFQFWLFSFAYCMFTFWWNCCWQWQPAMVINVNSLTTVIGDWICVRVCVCVFTRRTGPTLLWR